MDALPLSINEQMAALERKNEALRQYIAKLKADCAYYNECLQRQVSPEDYANIHVVHVGRFAEDLQVQVKVYFTYEQIFSGIEMMQSRIPLKEIFIQRLAGTILSCVQDAVERDRNGFLQAEVMR